MKYSVLIIIFFFLVSLNAQNYEDKYLVNNLHIAKGLGVHTDLGYSTYQIEVDSSEMDAAMDYNVLEYTLGVSYVYGEWLIGGYGKFLLDEIGSNMFISSSYKALNNYASISKKEFVFYLNHTLLRTEQSSWKFNGMYRWSSLEAKDYFLSYYHYNNYFNYTTRGIAGSLVYNYSINKHNHYFINIGMLYTHAKVEIYQNIESQLQDIFVKDTTTALGLKVAMGYSYYFSKHLIFNIRVDTWRLNFKGLEVNSLVGDQLPNASLKEQSFSSYIGVSWRF